MSVINIILVCIPFIFGIFGILQFFYPLLKDSKIIKYIYPQNYFRYIEVYIFTNMSIRDAHCNNTIIIMNSGAPGSTEDGFEFPFKICVPPKQKFSRNIVELHIKFETQKNVSLNIWEIVGSHNNPVKDLKLEQKDLTVGLEEKLSIRAFPITQETQINIKLQVSIKKRNKHLPTLYKCGIKINGIDDTSISLQG